MPKRSSNAATAASRAGRRSFRHSGKAPPSATPRAISRLSATVTLVKICGTWNEREMPAAMTARGGSFVISRPRNAIVPLLGFR